MLVKVIGKFRNFITLKLEKISLNFELQFILLILSQLLRKFKAKQTTWFMVFVQSNIVIKVADRLFVCPRSATIPNSTESSLLASDVPCPVTQEFTPMWLASETGSSQLLRVLLRSMFQIVSLTLTR